MGVERVGALCRAARAPARRRSDAGRRRALRSAGAFLAALSLLAVGAAAHAAPSPPERHALDGRTLLLNGAGVRERAYFVDVYSVGLYLPRPASHADGVRDPSIPKALRLQVLWDGRFPDVVPGDWREELMPALTAEQQAGLRRAYARFEGGETVWIEYTPASGTTVSVDGRRTMHDPGHEVFDAYLDLWIGDDPVSGDLKRELLDADS